MLHININDTKKLEITTEKEQTFINGEVANWDFVQISPNHYHIIFENKSYNAEVIHTDFMAKTFTVKINNNTYQLAAKDRFDLLLEQLGMGNSSAKKVNDLKAPMPGLILQVPVKEGDILKKGDTLLILEAMKMENVLKAQADITVKKVMIHVGDRVEKGQVLIVF
jgi:biotin carboxyl carrier protein